MRNTLPYHFAGAPKRLQRARLDNIAIVPASLLAHKERYKTVAKRLPTGSVLICTPHQSKQQRMLELVASYFRSSGHQVTTIPIDALMNRHFAIP